MRPTFGSPLWESSNPVPGRICKYDPQVIQTWLASWPFDQSPLVSGWEKASIVVSAVAASATVFAVVLALVSANRSRDAARDANRRAEIAEEIARKQAAALELQSEVLTSPLLSAAVFANRVEYDWKSGFRSRIHLVVTNSSTVPAVVVDLGCRSGNGTEYPVWADNSVLAPGESTAIQPFAENQQLIEANVSVEITYCDSAGRNQRVLVVELMPRGGDRDASQYQVMGEVHSSDTHSFRAVRFRTEQQSI